jgi:hypothetical protein
MSFWWEAGAGPGGEGRARGIKAVDFKQGPEKIGIHHLSKVGIFLFYCEHYAPALIFYVVSAE